MIITKITEQAKNPDRANIYVDGKFFAGVNKLVVFQLGLKAGIEMPPTLANRLSQAESTNSIWEYSLRSLSVAPKSRRRMQDKLAARFTAEEVQPTLDRLQADGLIDDARLADGLVRSLVSSKRKSRREILAVLLGRGIPTNLAQEAMARVPAEYDLLAAQQLLRTKQSSRDDQQKLTQYLGRKGFGYATIKQALSANQLDAEESGDLGLVVSDDDFLD